MNIFPKKTKMEPMLNTTPNLKKNNLKSNNQPASVLNYKTKCIFCCAAETFS